jgi:hypothetical protein
MMGIAPVVKWPARRLSRLLMKGVSPMNAPDTRYLSRALVIAMTSPALALGIVYGSRATLLIAAVILTEELYETGVVLLVLRRHRS